MTRTSSILILVLLGAAVSAAPAGASDGYQSLNAVLGEQPASSDYNSVNALVGADSGDRSPVSSTDTDPSSLNAILGAGGVPQQSPQPAVEIREDDEFDWFDALIGALIASGLTLMTLAAGRTVARHRRATAESHA